MSPQSPQHRNFPQESPPYLAGMRLRIGFACFFQLSGPSAMASELA